MKSIQVHLQEPTAKGRLYVSHVPETQSDVLVIKSRVRERFFCTINVSTEVLLDLDANRILTSVTVLNPIRLWRVTSPMRLPRTVQAADLQIEARQKAESIDLPVLVTTDESKSFAYVQFGEIPPNAIAVALSEECVAIISEDQLRGLFVTLVAQGRPRIGQS